MKRTENKSMLERRSFLKISLLAGGGVMLGLTTGTSAEAQGRGGPPAAPARSAQLHQGRARWHGHHHGQESRSRARA